MGWSMVDAVAKLEEAEDEQQFSVDSKSTTGGTKDKAVAPKN